MEVIDDLSKTETDNVYLVDFRIAGLNMTHLKHDHKSKPQGQQMPVETGKMTLTISKLRVPYKNKKLKKSVSFTHAATHIFRVFTINIDRAYNWKDSFKIDSAFTAFKRNTAFQTRHVKVVPFGNRRYTSCESGTFSVQNYVI